MPKLGAALLALPLLLSAALPEGIGITPEKEIIRLTGRYQKHKLRKAPLIVGSEKVVLIRPEKRALSRDEDYVIDYDKGEVLFLLPVEGEAVVEVEYKAVDLKPLYTYPLFKAKRPSRQTEPFPLRTVGIEPIRSDLHVSGTKSFGLSMGTGRSISPTQSLRVNVSGRVGRDIEVTAVLTDQDLPIQPEGTTEEIRDLDRVYISIFSPFFRAVLGDYQTGFEGGELVMLPRSIQGARLDLSRGGYTFTALGAMTRGKSGSMVIKGVEGQSQYRITVDGRYVVVVAGSERVWLNGKRMRRGGRNDYVIRDYGDPVIEFTPKHVITSNDVIRVDFEYIDEFEPYRQELYSFSLRREMGKGGYLQVGYASERDRAELKGFPLSRPPSKHVVRGISGSLKLPTDISLGFGLASSLLDEDVTSPSNPLKKGGALRLTASRASEKLSFNLLARLTGSGFFPVGATPWGRIRSDYEREFAMERSDEVLIEGIARPSVPPSEGRYEFELSASPLESLKLRTTLSRTEEDYPDELGMDFDRLFWRQSLALAHPSLPTVLVSGEMGLVSREERRDYSKRAGSIEISKSIGPLNVGLMWRGFESVDLNPQDGLDRSASRSIGKGELGMLEGRSLAFRLSCELEDLTRFGRRSRAGTASLEVNLRRGTLDLRGVLSRRRLKTEGESSTVNLADISFRSSAGGAVTIRGGYKIDRRLAPRRIEQFVKVPKGQGNYVKIDELHYREDYLDGEYIKIVRTIGDFPVSSVEADLKVTLRPPKLKGVSLDLSTSVVDEQEEGDLLRLYTFRNLRSDRTVYGRASSRIRLDLFPSRKLKGSVSLAYSDSLNRRTNFLSRRLSRRSVRWGFEWAVGGRLSAFQNGEISSERERIEGATASSAIEGEEGSAEAGLRLNIPKGAYVEGALKFDRNDAVDKLLPGSQTSASMLSLIMKGSCPLAGRGRFMISYRLGFGRVRGTLPIATYNLYDGISHEGTISADWWLQTFTGVILRFNYRFLAARSKGFDHRADVEAVAEF